MRYARALWPVLFLVPLTLWADRLCWLAGVDPLYHAIVWLHERLGYLVAFLAALSATVVAANVVMARLRFRQLRSVAGLPPARVREAIARAAADLGAPTPRVLYLEIAEPIAATVFGRTVLLSHGFVAPLDEGDLDCVVRHELAHVRNGDATAGVFWHLAFAALLVPGFEPLERRLHARRERRANVQASSGREERYVALLGRIARGTVLCSSARLGVEAASVTKRDRWAIWVAPAGVAMLAVGLPLSHSAFRHDLPFLLAHHC